MEDDVADLEVDVEELRTDDNLQDERLNTVEEAVIANVNEIDGRLKLTAADFKLVRILLILSIGSQ